MMRICAIFFILAMLALGAAAAQSLPQSTQDRQAIADLEYRLNQPGITPQQRIEIQERITELQYRIGTRPPIEPIPTLSPFMPYTSQGSFPSMPVQRVPMTVPAYGSCEGDRAVLAYLQDEEKSETASSQERAYIAHRISALRYEMALRHCAQRG